MTVEKATIKQGAAHEIGCELDDLLVGQQSLIQRWTGATEALGLAARQVGDLMRHAQAEIEAGELTLEEGALVRKWITRAQAVCSSASKGADNRRLQAEGGASALGAAVGRVKRYHDSQAREPRAEQSREEAREEARKVATERRKEKAAKATKKATKKKTAAKRKPAKKKAAKRKATRSRG